MQHEINRLQKRIGLLKQQIEGNESNIAQMKKLNDNRKDELKLAEKQLKDLQKEAENEK